MVVRRLMHRRILLLWRWQRGSSVLLLLRWGHRRLLRLLRGSSTRPGVQHLPQLLDFLREAAISRRQLLRGWRHSCLLWRLRRSWLLLRCRRLWGVLPRL